MLIKRPYRTYRCAHIVKPGEYMVSIWDGKQCIEANPALMLRCEICGEYFCFSHWPKHDETKCIPNESMGDIV